MNLEYSFELNLEGYGEEKWQLIAYLDLHAVKATCSMLSKHGVAGMVHGQSSLTDDDFCYVITITFENPEDIMLLKMKGVLPDHRHDDAGFASILTKH